MGAAQGLGGRFLIHGRTPQQERRNGTLSRNRAARSERSG
jgi:hypothetical protein